MSWFLQDVICRSPSRYISRFLWRPYVQNVFIRTGYWTLSSARQNQSTLPCTSFLKFNLISKSHICIGILSDLVLSGFPNIIPKAFLTVSVQATCLVHCTYLDSVPLIICVQEYKFRDHTLHNFLNLPLTPSIFISKTRHCIKHE